MGFKQCLHKARCRYSFSELNVVMQLCTAANWRIFCSLHSPCEIGMFPGLHYPWLACSCICLIWMWCQCFSACILKGVLASLLLGWVVKHHWCCTMYVAKLTKACIGYILKCYLEHTVMALMYGGISLYHDKPVWKTINIQDHHDLQSAHIFIFYWCKYTVKPGLLNWLSITLHNLQHA